MFASLSPGGGVVKAYILVYLIQWGKPDSEEVIKQA